MNRKYFVLAVIIGTLIICVSIMKHMCIQIEGYVGNIIGTFVFMLPIEILLLMLSKNPNIKVTTRKILFALFLFIIVCYFLGALIVYKSTVSGSL